MAGGGKITLDGGSGNGQWQHSGRQDSKAIVMGNKMAATQWAAQWAADDRCQCRSSAIGGNARWMAAAITMDGGGMIAMDGGSGDGQRRRNGRWDVKAIRMSNGTAAA